MTLLDVVLIIWGVIGLIIIWATVYVQIDNFIAWWRSKKGVDLLKAEDKQHIDRIEQLEADIQEYKDVIDSLKQKIDVSECLYEDSKKEIKQLEADIREQEKIIEVSREQFDTAEYLYAENRDEQATKIKQLESDIGKLIKKWKKEYNNTEYSITAQIEINRFLHDLKALEGKDG